MFAATVGTGPVAVAEAGGTTDAVAWVPRADVAAGALPVSSLVTAALGMRPGR